MTPPAASAMRRDAENGDKVAQFGLGYLYAIGRGVGKDNAEAENGSKRLRRRGLEFSSIGKIRGIVGELAHSRGLAMANFDGSSNKWPCLQDFSLEKLRGVTSISVGEHWAILLTCNFLQVVAGE